MRWALVSSESQLPILHKLFSCFLCVTLICGSLAPPSFSQVPLAGAVAQSVAGLGALATGLHGLVNDAISQANNALADRLKQLEGVVNG